jgi:hypothetical protein
MGIIEYAPHTNPDWDPFSVVYKVSNFLLILFTLVEKRLCLHIIILNQQVPGANMSMDLKDCAGPVGTWFLSVALGI